MSSIGGNWKDLLKASGNGDIALVKYHLQQRGVDPNFQHAEFFTAPIFEAIRNGHLDIVKVLIEQGKTNPQLVEEFTDMTPIELALEEQQHDIVDYLNTILPEDKQWIPKHVLVTGGNRGIGKAICQLLLQQGHHVVFTCRSQSVGEETKQELMDIAKNSKINYLVGDLSSISSTYQLAETIIKSVPDLNVLIHNAGIWPTEKIIVKEEEKGKETDGNKKDEKNDGTNDDDDVGIELSFMVNYLAPYILNKELYPILKRNGPSRIVLVTAGLYVFGNADISKTPYGTDFGALSTYRNTKQCGMIHLMHLARTTTITTTATSGSISSNNNDDETKKGNMTTTTTPIVTMTAVHPGVIQTGLGTPSNGCFACILRAIKSFWKKPNEGAIAPVWLAVSPESKDFHGQYFDDNLKSRPLEADVTNPQIQDEWYQWTEDFLLRKKRRQEQK